MTSAMSGSRSNFDQIVKWSRDNQFPFQAEANRAFESAALLNFSSHLVNVQFDIDWKGDTSTMTFPQAVGALAVMPSRLHPALVDFVWGRTDFPKRDRMEFLLRVIETDENLRAVLKAGFIFSKEAGINNTVADFGIYSDW